MVIWIPDRGERGRERLKVETEGEKFFIFVKTKVEEGDGEILEDDYIYLSS